MIWRWTLTDRKSVSTKYVVSNGPGLTLTEGVVILLKEERRPLSKVCDYYGFNAPLWTQYTIVQILGGSVCANDILSSLCIFPYVHKAQSLHIQVRDPNSQSRMMHSTVVGWRPQDPLKSWVRRKAVKFLRWLIAINWRTMIETYNVRFYFYVFLWWLTMPLIIVRIRDAPCLQIGQSTCLALVRGVIFKQEHRKVNEDGKAPTRLHTDCRN